MSSHGDIDRRDGHAAHAGHGFWAMVACCLPMIVIFALIALKVL